MSREAARVVLAAGIDIAGGKHDLVYRNDVSDQGSYGIVTIVFVNSRSGGFPNARCQSGRTLPAGGCFFNASGDAIADNTLQHNGTFENPTNGDLADATVADSAPNCYRGNTQRSGRPLAQRCAAAHGHGFFGVLGVQVCAVRAFGDCDNRSAALSPLSDLSRALHIPFNASTVRNARAVYPSPGHYVASPPGPQPSLRP